MRKAVNREKEDWIKQPKRCDPGQYFDGESNEHVKKAKRALLTSVTSRSLASTDTSIVKTSEKI